MEIIVDLFNQHSGDMNTLKRMALSAYLSGADVVKIQILNSKRIWGDDSRRYLEMSFEEVKEISDYCRGQGIEFMATVFDEEKLEWLDEIGVNRYKIASVTAKNDRELCEKILKKNKETIISLGGYEMGEFPFGFDDNIKYLFCVAQYPTFLHDKALKKMPDRFTDKGYYGFSDHVVGIAASVQSYFRGARILEKHFTFNRNIQNEYEKAHLCSFSESSLKTFKELTTELDILNSN